MFGSKSAFGRSKFNLLIQNRSNRSTPHLFPPPQTRGRMKKGELKLLNSSKSWLVVQLEVATESGKQERFLPEFTLRLAEGLEMKSRVSCHPERRERSCPNWTTTKSRLDL